MTAVKKAAPARRELSENTLADGNATEAPAADAILARVAPEPGVYSVELCIILTGKAESAPANLRLSDRIGVGIRHVFTDLPSSTGHAVSLRLERVRLDPEGGEFGVTVAANATRGSVYTTHLAVTRLA